MIETLHVQHLAASRYVRASLGAGQHPNRSPPFCAEHMLHHFAGLTGSNEIVQAHPGRKSGSPSTGLRNRLPREKSAEGEERWFSAALAPGLQICVSIRLANILIGPSLPRSKNLALFSRHLDFQVGGTCAHWKAPLLSRRTPIADIQGIGKWSYSSCFRSISRILQNCVRNRSERTETGPRSRL
jgi:hypothetical protein